MHPVQVIELLFFGFILIVLIVLRAFFLKFSMKRGKQVMQIIIILYMVAVSIFYLIRPMYIEANQLKKIEFLHGYLETTYPSEKWTISAYPFRMEGFENRGHYTFDVIFSNEPEVIYTYSITSEQKVLLQSFYHKKGKSDFLHVIE